jgi:hypothetical protein
VLASPTSVKHRRLVTSATLPKCGDGWRVRACGTSPKRAFDARETKIARGPWGMPRVASRQWKKKMASSGERRRASTPSHSGGTTRRIIGDVALGGLGRRRARRQITAVCVPEPQDSHQRSLPSLVRATGVPDINNLQESSRQRARGPREFASVQRIVGVGYGGVEPLPVVRGPITSARPGRIPGVGARAQLLSQAFLSKKRRPVNDCEYPARRPDSASILYFTCHHQFGDSSSKARWIWMYRLRR